MGTFAAIGFQGDYDLFIRFHIIEALHNSKENVAYQLRYKAVHSYVASARGDSHVSFHSYPPPGSIDGAAAEVKEEGAKCKEKSSEAKIV